jgi:competence protein ComEA
MRLLHTLHDRLGFTPAELRAVLLLALALVVGTAVRLLRVPAAAEAPATPASYATLDSLFAARSRTTIHTPGTPTGRQRKRSPAARSVDINRATLDELLTLPGIGPVNARRILDYRAAHGPFRSVEALAEVRGIGPRTLQRLRPFVAAP